MKTYKPGDTFTTQMLEFVAHHDNANGCDGCIGKLHESVCDMLPPGCGDDELSWKARNESAKALQAILKLEGHI